MNKKIITAGLALCLGLGGLYTKDTIQNPAYASSRQEKIDSIDTRDLEIQISAAKYLLENYPRTLNAETRVKLQKLVIKAEGILDRVNRLKQNTRANNNLNIRVKNIIRANLAKRNETFTVSIKSYTSNKQIQDWFLQTAKEDWYFFYSMYGKTNVKTKYNPKKTKGDKTYIESVTFTVTYRENPALEYDVENFTTDWVNNNIDPGETDLSKVTKIHDFIVTKNQYNRGDSRDISGGYSIYHPTSILYGNGGVCNAYATLFDKLATKAGLSVRYATGYSKKTGEPHIWNMVKVDGNWYNIDTTWDDPTITFNQGDIANLGDFVIYDYFLKNDQQIQESRTIDQDPNKPQATSTLNTGLQNSTIQKIGDEYRVVR